jgi:hypothetical protein
MSDDDGDEGVALRITAERWTNAIHRPICHTAAVIPITVNAMLSAGIDSE